MKPIELLVTYKSIPEQNLFHESYVIEAMEAYANIKIEQLKNDFLEQLTAKNKEISDLRNEIYVQKDLMNALNSQAMMMNQTYEYMLEKVAEESWNNGRYTFNNTFKEWWGKRTLLVE